MFLGNGLVWRLGIVYVICCADEGRGVGDGSILLRLMDGRFVLRCIRMCLLEEVVLKP